MAPSPPRLKILSGMWLRLRRTLCDVLLLSVLQCLTGLHIPPTLPHVRQRILRDLGGNCSSLELAPSRPSYLPSDSSLISTLSRSRYTASWD